MCLMTCCVKCIPTVHSENWYDYWVSGSPDYNADKSEDLPRAVAASARFGFFALVRVFRVSNPC